MKTPMHKERGQAMITATMLFLAISLSVIFGFSGPIFRGKAILSDALETRKSFYLSEAGLETAAVGASAPSLGGFSPSVQSSQNGDEYTYTSTANWNGSVHVTEAIVEVSTTTTVILSWKEIK